MYPDRKILYSFRVSFLNGHVFFSDKNSIESIIDDPAPFKRIHKPNIQRKTTGKQSKFEKITFCTAILDVLYC